MRKLLIIWILLIGIAQAQSKAGFYVVGGKVITVQDTSSRKYLKAIENAGVVPSVIQNAASNFLVTSEKAIGSYSLMTAQYPFIGGTAATHKFNLNNPVDTDAGFRLTFPNGATHDASGVLFNGTNQYANTFLNPTTALANPKNDISLSFFITGGTGAGASSVPNTMGAQGNNNTDFGNYETLIYHRPTSAFFITAGENFPTNYAGGSISFANGYILGTTKSNSLKLWIRGNVFASSTPSASGFAASGNLFIGNVSLNTSTPASTQYQNVRLGYAEAGLGFTDNIAIQQSRIVKFFNSMQNR